MSIQDDITLRSATAVDLSAINVVIDAAVMTWQLLEGVKRLVVPSYRYRIEDLRFLTLIFAPA